MFICGGDEQDGCPCRCGICTLDDCKCACHNLDGLSNEYVKQILVQHTNHNLADVSRLSRNELFGLMARSDDPMALLRHGVNMFVKLQRQQGVDEEGADDSFIACIANMSSSRNTTSPVPKSTAQRASTPEKLISKKTANKKKTQNKNKTAEQKKRARALARCAT